jgi:hypothetical protein
MNNCSKPIGKRIWYLSESGISLSWAVDSGVSAIALIAAPPIKIRPSDGFGFKGWLSEAFIGQPNQHARSRYRLSP